MRYFTSAEYTPDSKVHGANMGPIWGRQDPGGPQVGHMNFALWDVTTISITLFLPEPLLLTQIPSMDK